MRILSLDISTKTGYAVFEDGKYKSSGALPKVFVKDFNVNKEPQKSSEYPWNIIDAADEVAKSILALYSDVKPDVMVLEDTNKGRNRATQRCLEWLHYSILKILRPFGKPIKYMDSSEWRKIVGLKLNQEQRKNNKDVSAGKKRGKVNKKHLSVLMTNEKFGLTLLLKDNDQSDACLLGLAFVTKNS